MILIKKVLAASAVSGLIAINGFAADADLIKEGEKNF